MAITVLGGLGAGVNGVTIVAAIAGAALVMAAAAAVNRIVNQPLLILVLGLLFGYAADALTTLLMASSPREGLERYVIWSFGSFGIGPGVGPRVIALTAIGATLAVTLIGPRVDTLLLGSRYAESSGVHTRRLHGAAIVTAGTLTGVVTAFTGPISFLGVAVPHIARGWMRSSRHRVLTPATALIGATLAVIADLIARLPGSDRILPLNAVTALIGVPVVLWVLLRPASMRGGERGLGL